MPADLEGQEPVKYHLQMANCWLALTIKCTTRKRPTKLLISLVSVCLKLYFPGWFKFKTRPHIQNGPNNLFYLDELPRNLPIENIEI